MIKNWLINLLKSLCGDLIEDYSKEDFELNKWQGTGERKNVKLNPNKIQHFLEYIFGMPLLVQNSVIGLFKFQIYWNKIWKEPTKIIIKDAFIHAKTTQAFSLDFMERRKWKYKNIQIDKECKKYNSLFQGSQSRLTKALKNFFAEMITIEIENFHLQIDDDMICLKHHKVVTGVRFDKLTLGRNSDLKAKSRTLNCEISGFNIQMRVENLRYENQSNLIDPINFSVALTTRTNQPMENCKDDQTSNNDPLRLIEINFPSQLTTNVDNVQFHAILRLIQLKQWHSQQGGHFSQRPLFNMRPKDHKHQWQSYLVHIIKTLVAEKRANRDSLKSLLVKKKQREYYINLLLIELFCPCQDKVFEFQLDGLPIKLTQEKFHEEKLNLEKLLQTEEIVWAWHKASIIINCQELLKEKLNQLQVNLQLAEIKKSSYWNPLQYIWKKSPSTEALGPEFDDLYEKFKQRINLNEGQLLREFRISIHSVTSNVRILIDKSFFTFLKIDIDNLNYFSQTKMDLSRVSLSVKQLLAIDSMNPTQEHQKVISYHQYIHRSKFMQYQNQSKDIIQIEYSYQQQPDFPKICSMRLTILPVLISLNNTVMQRIIPFLQALGQKDQFAYLILLSQEYLQQSQWQKLISQILQNQDIDLRVIFEQLTVRIPESAIRSNCSMLEMELQNYELVQNKRITQRLNAFSIKFLYFPLIDSSHQYQQVRKQQITILEPIKLISTLDREIKPQAQIISIRNQISDIKINLTEYDAQIVRQYIMNVLDTFENFHKFEGANVHYSLTQKSIRKRSHSQPFQRDFSSKSRIDDASSQAGSEIFYDLDELNLVQQVSIICNESLNLSRKDQRDEIMKKWIQLKQNLNYMLTRVYSKVDKQILALYKQTQLDIQSQIPLIEIVIGKVSHARTSSFKLQGGILKISKDYQQSILNTETEIKLALLAIYKLESIKDICYIFQKNQQDLLQNFNQEMLGLLPFLLKIKELQIHSSLKVHEAIVQLQIEKSSDQQHFDLRFSSIQMETIKPLTVFYANDIKEPFFLQINNLKVSRWTADLLLQLNAEITYKIERMEKNEKIVEGNQILQQTKVELQIKKSSSDIATRLTTDSLEFYLTPALLYYLYQLNEHSIQLKSHLITKSENDKANNRGKQGFEPLRIQDDNISILVSQQDISYKQHRKPKFLVTSLDKIQGDLTFQADLQDVISERTNECQSEKNQIQHEPVGSRRQYIILNMINAKLFITVNGIEHKLKAHKFKLFNCQTKFTMQIAPSLAFHFSEAISHTKPGVQLIRCTRKQDFTTQIHYILTIYNFDMTVVYHIEQLPWAPYLIKNKCSQNISICQEMHENRRVNVEPSLTKPFCWDNPFENKLLQMTIEKDDRVKMFLIDIDGFNDQEILIDKDLCPKIDLEYCLEIFHDGAQKVIIITEKEVQRVVPSVFQLAIKSIGFSIIKQGIEIAYLTLQQFLIEISTKDEFRTMLLEFEYPQIDSMCVFIPKRQLFVPSSHQNNGLQQSVRKIFSGTSQADNRDKSGLFQIQCKQLITSEILLHISSVKITIPNFKFVLDGALIHQLIEFGNELRNRFSQHKQVRTHQLDQSLNSSNNLTNTSFEIRERVVQPKKIHIDKVEVRPFSIKLKFKNLTVIEHILEAFHSLAGLVSFLLSQLKSLYFEFSPYARSTLQQTMNGNYEIHVKEILDFYMISLTKQLEQQINASNILKNQANLSKQINTELTKLIKDLNDNDQDVEGISFKFQLLETSLSIFKTMMAAFDETLENVLYGVQKYFDAQNASEHVNRKSFSSKLSSIFMKVSTMHRNLMPYSHHILQYNQILSKLKTRRPPLYIKGLQFNSDEGFGKLQLYKMWKEPDNRANFDIQRITEVLYVYVSKQWFTILDLKNDCLRIELQTEQILTVSGDQEECCIRYNCAGDDEDVGMKQFKVKKLVLSARVSEGAIKEMQETVKKYNKQSQTKSNFFNMLLD